MYKAEKINELITYIKEKKKATQANLKPYLVIAQPRRDAKEQAAQNFVGDKTGITTWCSYRYINISGQLVDVARNALAEKAIESEAKYLFFIGEDTVVPYYAFEELQRTCEENPNTVASGVYYFKEAGAMVLIQDEQGYRRTANVDPNQMIHNPLLIGIDAMLIPIQILKELKEKEPDCPFFCVVSETENNPFLGEDEWFLQLLYKNRYNCIVNTNVQCLHMDLATGNYNAHKDVDLNDYVCAIKPNRRLTCADRQYLSRRWNDRMPTPNKKEILKQLK
jgi:hypothetical protein